MTNRKKESHHDRLHFLITTSYKPYNTHTHTHTYSLSYICGLLFFSLSLLPHLPRNVGVVSHCEVSVRESDTVLIRVLGKLLNRCHQQAHPTLVAWGGNRCVRAWACVGVRGRAWVCVGVRGCACGWHVCKVVFVCRVVLV